MFGTVTAIFLLYLLLNIESLKASWQLTERGTYLSYGVYIIFDLLDAWFRYYLIKVVPEDQIQTIMRFVPHLFALLLLAGIFFIAMKHKGAFPVNSERNLAAFRLGAAIYVGTFLLGNNWNYRLVFLMFVIPQISQWFFASPGKYRWLYLGVFIVMFASFWDTVIFDYGLRVFGEKYKMYLFIFDEMMNWGVFSGLAYLLIASSPAWFRAISLNPQRVFASIWHR